MKNEIGSIITRLQRIEAALDQLATTWTAGALVFTEQDLAEFEKIAMRHEATQTGVPAWAYQMPAGLPSGFDLAVPDPVCHPAGGEGLLLRHRETGQFVLHASGGTRSFPREVAEGLVALARENASPNQD
jgi:hypothetical protein